MCFQLSKDLQLQSALVARHPEEEMYGLGLQAGLPGLQAGLPERKQQIMEFACIVNKPARSIISHYLCRQCRGDVCQGTLLCCVMMFTRHEHLCTWQRSSGT